LGYPKIIKEEIREDTGTEVEVITGSADGVINEVNNDERSPTGEVDSKTDDQARPHPQASRKPERRSTTRLISYVEPINKQSQSLDSSVESRRTKVERCGIDLVMAYERQNNRKPTEQPVNHPGYDIESEDSSGEILYIEVKSLSGIWDRHNPAQLTKCEFDTAHRVGQKFWLYIVELAGSGEEVLYRIQNPLQLTDHFLFDHGWEDLAEKWKMEPNQAPSG